MIAVTLEPSPNSKTTNGENMVIWLHREVVIHPSHLVEQQWFWVDIIVEGKSVLINNLFILFLVAKQRFGI